MYMHGDHHQRSFRLLGAEYAENDGRRETRRNRAGSKHGKSATVTEGSVKVGT
jgi:hypothetical protein